MPSSVYTLSSLKKEHNKMCDKMDPKFIEKAKLELNETDLRRTQSLKQFRSWIDKHSFLSGIRQDDKHLLQFLRARKFNMSETFKNCEKFYAARWKYPQFFDSNEEEFEKLMRMIETGFCCPLSERDVEGRKTVLISTSRWNIDEYSVLDSVRVFLFVLNAMLEAEETQISGVLVIFDYSAISVKKLLSPHDAVCITDLVKSCSVIRQKGNYFFNLPQIANFFIQIVKASLSEKLRNRLFVVKDLEDLKNFFDVKLLPKEYGGSKSIGEMLKEFLRFYEKHKDQILRVWHTKIKWSDKHIQDIWKTETKTESLGSFRKLEID